MSCAGEPWSEKRSGRLSFCGSPGSRSLGGTPRGAAELCSPCGRLIRTFGNREDPWVHLEIHRSHHACPTGGSFSAMTERPTGPR